MRYVGTALPWWIAALWRWLDRVGLGWVWVGGPGRRQLPCVVP